MCLAIPGQLLEIIGDDPLLRSGKVSFGGTVKEINLAFVPEARPEDFVLVHVGFAIGVIDEAEARRVLRYLDEIGNNKPPVDEAEQPPPTRPGPSPD